MRDQHHWYRRILKEMAQNRYVQERLVRGDFDAHLTAADLKALGEIRGPDWKKPLTPEEFEKLNSAVAEEATPTSGL
jgi:hypothetical protein